MLNINPFDGGEAEFAHDVIGKRGCLKVRNISFSYRWPLECRAPKPTTSRRLRGHLSANTRRHLTMTGSNPGMQMQITRVGRVAEQPETLATARRAALPRHPVAQRHQIRISVWRRNFKRDIDEPFAFRSKRQFLGV